MPGTPAGTSPNSAQVGQFNITQIGDKADKAINDNNFRCETIYRNTLCVTEGSGTNGTDAVYQIVAPARWPTAPTRRPATRRCSRSCRASRPGSLKPTPTTRRSACSSPIPNTLYVSDEGIGGAADADVGSHAGLEKWSLIHGTWRRDYTLRTGVIGTTQATTLPGSTARSPSVACATSTGKMNPNGTVTIYGITTDNTSNLDNGVDLNEVVDIADTLGDTTLPTGESFNVLEASVLGAVYRGVSAAPVSEPGSLGILGSVVAGCACCAAAAPAEPVAASPVTACNRLRPLAIPCRRCLG